MRYTRPAASWIDATLDDDGTPPCSPPDDCTVCVLFTAPRPGDDRADHFARITGYTKTRITEAS